MKTLAVVFERLGENATTAASPMFLLKDFRGDLEEKKVFCASADNDMRVDGNRYLLRSVILPDWMSFNYYKANYVKLMFFVGLGGSLEWDQAVVEYLVELSQYDKAVLSRFYKSNPRKEFRKSLHNQLKTFLEKPESRKFEFPFSNKQYSFLTSYVNRWEVERDAEKIYWASQYQEWLGHNN